MIESKVVYVVKCDECGEVLDAYGEGGFSVYEDVHGAFDAMEDSGWSGVRLAGATHICRECAANAAEESQANTQQPQAVNPSGNSEATAA